MVKNYKYKGEDLVIDQVITDFGGLAIDFETKKGVIAYLRYKDGKVLAKYSQHTRSGFQNLALPDINNGKIRIYLKSEDTVNARVDDDIYLEVKVAFNEEQFTGSEQMYVWKQYLLTFSDSVSQDERQLEPPPAP